MTTAYRNADLGDAETLDHLFDTIFCGTFGHLYRAEDLELFLTSFGIDDWRRQLSDPAYAFRLAEDDGEAVGYLKLGPMKLPIETTGPALLVDQLYVRQDHQGAGIAQGLMDWAIEEARRRGAEALYLTVYVDNERARRFYNRYGFEPAGRYDFMVGNQRDEDIILRRAL